MAVTINGTTGIVTPDIGVDGSTLVIDSANNRVGVLEDSPSNTLTVGDTIQPSYAPTRAGNYIEIARTSGADAGLLINKDTGQWLVGINNGDGSNAPLRFEYAAAGSSHPGLGAGTLGMIIKHDGKVGIGTDNPNTKLQIVTTSGARALTVTAPTLGPYIVFETDTTPFADIGSEAGLVGSGSNTDMLTLNARGSRSLSFRTNSNERLRITSGGGLKFISADSPTSTSEPAQILNHSGGWQFYGSSSTSTNRNIIFCSASNAASERLRIAYDGNVNIGNKNHLSHHSTVDSLQIGYALNLYEDSYTNGTDNYVVLGNNIYYNSGNKYMRNDEASRIMMQAGTFYFQSAAAGTAGNAISFTDVLRITNTGDIGINLSTPTSQSGKVVHISGDNGGQARIHLSTSASGHGADEGHYIVSQGAESGANAGQLAIINMENRNITFTTGSAGANTARLTIQHDGNLNIADGNLVVGTNGHGIDFSADGNNGNMTSELLDDYEEGTWTPTIRENGTSTAWNTLSNQIGTYTKVGRLVTISFKFEYSARATNVNQSFYAWIAGLPFSNTTSGVNEGAGSLMIARSGGSTTPYHIYLISSQGNTMGVYGNQDSTTPGPMMTSEWPNTACQVRGQYIYYVP